MNNLNNNKKLSEDKINDVLIYLKTIGFQNCEYRYDKFHFDYPDHNAINKYVSIHYDECTCKFYISTVGTRIASDNDIVKYKEQLDESIEMVTTLNSFLENK